MESDYTIRLKNVDLIYTSAESLSFKKLAKKIIGKRDTSILKCYKALDDISLTIEKGKVYGIIGNNGAGKSTLLRVLSGVMSPNCGTVERNYNSINLLALGIGFSKELSGIDNVYLNGMLLGFSKSEINKVKDQIIEYSEIGDFIQRPMKTYSSGMISRLGFAIAIHLKPEVLLIDEVLSVGDTKFREKSFESIRKIIQDENITVVIVTHSMNQVEQLCDEVIWLDKGHMLLSGDKMEVLGLYQKYNEGKLSIKDIKNNNTDFIAINNNCLEVNLTKYQYKLPNASRKDGFGKTIDFVQSYRVGKTDLKITKRDLSSGDVVLYFEIENPLGLSIEVELEHIIKTYTYDSLYQKPDFDKRYGENKVTSAFSYLDLVQGSIVVSKIYSYKKLSKSYGDNGSSHLFEFLGESSPDQLSDKSMLRFFFTENVPNSSFFLLISNEKLFKDIKNLDNYMDYYYKSIYNNTVWCSYFMLPSGTYTKLPYSIEPFTKDGYGYSLHHSSRKDLIPFYQQTKERFYINILENAILQAYLYQKQQNGVFFSSYTSTWLSKNYGITAPYIDTRLNENFILMVQDIQKEILLFHDLDPMKDYMDFLYIYYESGKNIYCLGEGVFFPDYFKMGISIAHASLNHQLGTALMFLNAYIKYNDSKYFAVYRSILKFVEVSSEQWINPESGDLFYGVKADSNGTLIYYDKDYIYVTLIDLLLLSRKSGEHLDNMELTKINYLICKKVEYLQTTEYDIFNPESKFAPGEKIDSCKQALALYHDVKNMYPNDFDL